MGHNDFGPIAVPSSGYFYILKLALIDFYLSVNSLFKLNALQQIKNPLSENKLKKIGRLPAIR